MMLLAIYLILGGATYRHSGKAVLPDRTATPGTVDSTLTRERLCAPGFRTGSVRKVTRGMKLKVCRHYGLLAGCPGRKFELDHLIPIEIGGSEQESNLWPQPGDSRIVIGFHAKDVVENRAKRAVCDGRLTLKAAQQGMAGDWYTWGKQEGFIP